MSIGQVGMPVDFRLSLDTPRDLRGMTDRTLKDIGLERDEYGTVRRSGTSVPIGREGGSWFERLIRAPIKAAFRLRYT